MQLYYCLRIFDYRVPKVPKGFFKHVSKGTRIIASIGVREIFACVAFVSNDIYKYLNLRRNSQRIHNKLWKALDLKKSHHQGMPNHPHYHHFLRWDWMRYVDFVMVYFAIYLYLGFFCKSECNFIRYLYIMTIDI